MIRFIWQLPNNLVAWVALLLKPKDQIIDTELTWDGKTKVIITDTGINNFAPSADIVFAMNYEKYIEHELLHAKWAGRFGWFYLAPYYNLVLMWFFTSNGIYILCSLLGALGWFILQEYLAGNNVIVKFYKNIRGKE